MKVRFHPALCLYLLSMAALTSWATVAGAAAALIVHELGHLAACRLIGDSIHELELTPFGGVMTYKEGKSPSKGLRGIFAAAAGPMANGFSVLLLVYSDGVAYSLGRAAAASNFAMLCLNLLPVIPLDGGRILFCFGYYLFPVAQMIVLLSWLGVAGGIGLIFFSIYGLMAFGTLNCSLMIIGVYLACCAHKTKGKMLIENYFTVLQEKAEVQRPVQLLRAYRVRGDTRLLELMPLLTGADQCEFVCNEGANEWRISEKMLREKLLEKPTQSIEDAFHYRA